MVGDLTLSLPVSKGPDIAADAQTAALVQVIASPQSSSGDRSGASEGGYACLSGSSILSGVLARILVHPSLKIGQQSVM